MKELITLLAIAFQVLVIGPACLTWAVNTKVISYTKCVQISSGMTVFCLFAFQIFKFIGAL